MFCSSTNVSLIDIELWRRQIKQVAQKGLRNSYLLSAFAFLAGLFFFILFLGLDVKGAARGFFREARGWWPMFAMSIVMVGLCGLGVRFARKHSKMIQNALEQGQPCQVNVRFMDLSREEPIRFEAWFDSESNPVFGKTIKSSVWQKSPSTVVPPIGQATPAIALLDAKTRTPIAVTIGESTYIFDYPAES